MAALLCLQIGGCVLQRSFCSAGDFASLAVRFCATWWRWPNAVTALPVEQLATSRGLAVTKTGFPHPNARSGFGFEQETKEKSGLWIIRKELTMPRMTKFSRERWPASPQGDRAVAHSRYLENWLNFYWTHHNHVNTLQLHICPSSVNSLPFCCKVNRRYAI